MAPLSECKSLVFTEIFDLDLITSFNLFVIYTTICMGALHLLTGSRSNNFFKRESVVLKPWQQDFFLELFTVLKDHTIIQILVLLIGLLFLAVPMQVGWIWLISTGTLSTSIITLFAFVILLFPFFIIPNSILDLLYRSPVHPKEAPLEVIQRIIEKIHVLPKVPPSGETLEKAKKTPSDD